MSNTIWECALTVPRAEAERLADALANTDAPEALSVSLFELPDGAARISAHYAEKASRRALADLLAEAGWRGTFSFEPLPDTDWVARSQAQLAPVRAGRFLVHGRHDRGRAHGRHAIEIEANRAFGTAHHATTKGCLLALDALLKRAQPRRVLDLGCGSGVLAIAAARALKTQVAASDNDPVAVDIALENARANGEAARVSVCLAEGLEHPALRCAPGFDLVFANILLQPLLDLAPALSRKVAAGGWLILSGITNDQAAQLLARYRRLGFVPVWRRALSDWAVLVMRHLPFR